MKMRFGAEYDFFPETYYLPKEVNSFRGIYSEEKQNSLEELWILKAANLSRGRGIKVLSSFKEAEEATDAIVCR